MGYTEYKTDIQLGLGVSAISDSWACFHQNEKILKKYQKRLDGKNFQPAEQTKRRRFTTKKINLQLATQWKVELPDSHTRRNQEYLRTMEEDGLIEWNGKIIHPGSRQTIS